MVKPIGKLKRKWMRDPEFAVEYARLEREFAIAGVIIGARKHAMLTQKQLAERMGTSQSVIARLESGRVMPSIKTLFRIAEATGTHPEIRLVADA